MAFEIPKQPYSGKIGETIIGSGGSAVTLGGEDSYPFHLFEGKMPNPPKIAMEVWDYDPSAEWPKAAVAAFKDVMSSPEAWAKKCVEEHGADVIVLQLKSTDPNGMDRNADEAAQVVKRLADAVNVPLVCWGTANNQKDEEVLKKIAEVCQGKNLCLAPIEEGNHKGVGASAMGYGHTIVSSSPIDVNLAKQLKVLLGNLGVKSNKIVIDPTTGGLGYGMEYSYSVMERIRMAALTQEDDKLQIPMINNIGNEVWKSKEAGQGIEEAPTLGDPEKRPILMEAVAAVCYLMAGSDTVILRHPESVRLVRSYIDLMTNGGSASGMAGISKKLEAQEVDLAAISPVPQLDFEGGVAPAPAAEEVKIKKKAEPKKAKAKAQAEPKAEAEAEDKVKAEAEAKAKAKAEEEARIKAEAEVKAREEAEEKAGQAAKAKAEAEAKAKIEAEAKAEAKVKAEAEAKVKAEADAKAKAEAEAKAKIEAEARAKEKEKEELQAMRLKRAQEQEKQAAERTQGEARTATPAEKQMDLVDRLSHNLDRIHKRVK